MVAVLSLAGAAISVIFVAAKHVFCRDKETFCRGKHTFACFVATKMIPVAALANDTVPRQRVCAICLRRSKF